MFPTGVFEEMVSVNGILCLCASRMIQLDNSFIMLKSIEILGLRFFYFDESVCSKKKSIGAGVQ